MFIKLVFLTSGNKNGRQCQERGVGFQNSLNPWAVRQWTGLRLQHDMIRHMQHSWCGRTREFSELHQWMTLQLNGFAFHCQHLLSLASLWRYCSASTFSTSVSYEAHFDGLLFQKYYFSQSSSTLNSQSWTLHPCHICLKKSLTKTFTGTLHLCFDINVCFWSS